MKKYVFSFLLIGSIAFAQKLTIEETVMGPRKYASKTLSASQWRKDTKAVTYLSADFSGLMEKSASTNWTEATLVTKTELESALKAKISGDEFTLRTFPMVHWKSKNTFETELAGKIKITTLYLMLKQSKSRRLLLIQVTVQKQLLPQIIK